MTLIVKNHQDVSTVLGATQAMGTLGAKCPVLESWLLSLTVFSWATCLITLCLSFLIRKMSKITKYLSHSVDERIRELIHVLSTL